ncbi:MAG: D-glycero-beta-D-manno-heptose-1,7-bisphosphate 7-phosphatase [Elusimicrobia bacterium ADurb.Bin231]|nr:MAG: D-glycero-beta-D-manno-heptose-1,7-bisphosphate 7-phosphatase [Elusimicrobia bacterium ADurb.Bin231]
MLRIINDVLYYGLFVLAAAMPISIAATNIVWILLFLVWIAKLLLIKDRRAFVSPVTLPLAVFFCSTLFSALLGLNVSRSFSSLNSELLFLIFFLVSANIRDINHAKQILFVFIASSALMGVLAILQFSFNISSYGWLSLIDGRAHGTRSWSQTYAEGLLIALPVCLYAFLFCKTKRIFLYIFSSLIFAGIILSYVRMVWITCIFLISVILISEARQLKKVLLTFAGILIVFVAVTAFLLPNRINILKRARNMTEPVRINMWKASVEIFKDYPIFGVGKKNIKGIFSYKYKKLNLPSQYFMLSHLHNNFIHLLVERGIVGLLSFLYLVFAIFYFAIKRIRKSTRDEKFIITGCLFAFFGFLISGLTEYSYGDSEIQMIIWLIAGIMFHKKKAVFLDRDGTINDDMHYSADIDKLKIFPTSASAIRMLNDSGFRVIITTNQSGIARGRFSRESLDKLNEEVIRRLKEEHAVIDGVYVCPHHPDEHCKCRKPGIGMLLKAEKEFDINISASFVVGDMKTDIQLAKNAGCRGVFVLSGAEKTPPVVADYVASDILEAAKWIAAQKG